MDVEESPEQAPLAADIPEMPIVAEVSSNPKCPLVCGEMGGMAEDLANMPPPRIVAPMGGPKTATRIYDDVAYKELYTPCKKHSHRDRDARPLRIARLLATDQLARKPAGEERALLAVLRSAFAADNGVVKRHG